MSLEKGLLEYLHNTEEYKSKIDKISKIIHEVINERLKRLEVKTTEYENIGKFLQDDLEKIAKEIINIVTEVDYKKLTNLY